MPGPSKRMKQKDMIEYPSSVKQNKKTDTVVYTVFKFDVDVFKEEVCLPLDHGLWDDVEFDQLKPYLSSDNKVKAKKYTASSENHVLIALFQTTEACRSHGENAVKLLSKRKTEHY